MTVEVTQFVRPHGRRELQTTEVSDDCEAQYKAMQEAGCFLTAEVLPSGIVSLCIDSGEEDVAIVLASNGPAVQAGIEKILREFDSARVTREEVANAHHQA